MTMIVYGRELGQEIVDTLLDIPAVAILGPRQVGKTTLAFEISKEKPSLYLDLENPEDLQKLKNPVPYLKQHADKLIILDEVQQYPDIFASLRGIIDARRRQGNGNGQFLILGSASHALLKQSSESLAGRIHYLELSGLNPFEIESHDNQHIQKLWLRGGFPDSYTPKSDPKSYAWRQNFIRTYVERDIPMLGPRIPAETLRRFWTMLAHAQGELLSASKLAGSLGVKSVTISRYLDLMVDLLLVRRLQAWHGNVKKRLVKAPRIYVRDSGILHTLLAIPNYESLLGNPILGKSWEGFVIETISSILPANVGRSFYRSAAGAEIDLVLEFGKGNYWGIDIKASTTPTPKKGYHIACEDIKAKRKFVVYSGDDTFALDNETTVLSLPLLLAELRKAILA